MPGTANIPTIQSRPTRIFCFFLVVFATFAFVAPSHAQTIINTDHDDYLDAKVLPSSLAITAAGLGLRLSTIEPQEPRHFPGIDTYKHSLWAEWTAPESSEVVLEVIGENFEPIVSVYVGRTNALKAVNRTFQVASSNKSTMGLNRTLTRFYAIKDTVYQFAIVSENEIPIIDVSGLPQADVPGDFAFALAKPTTQAGTLFASTLPTARGGATNTEITAFATMINASSIEGIDCRIEPDPEDPRPYLVFSYQTVNAQNELTGSVNTPVNIPAGGSQGFVISVNGKEAADKRIEFIFSCRNISPPYRGRIEPGSVLDTLNVLLLGPSTADMISIAQTVSNNGIVELSGPTGANAFAVAAVNNSTASAGVLVRPEVPGSISGDVDVTICETQSNGSCVQPPSASVTITADPGTPKTFSVFVQGNNAIAFDPALNRIAISFRQPLGSQRLVGQTSVAVRTQ